MASNRLTVRQDDVEKFIVTSNDSNIKQVFFGWASGRDYPEFYGRSIETDKNVHVDKEWQWDLTMELVKHLYMNILNDLDHQRKSLPDGEWKTLKAEDDVLKALGDILANKKPEELDEFTKAYIIAALWSTNDESTPAGGDPLDDNYGVSDISPESMVKIKADCAKFQAENKAMIECLLNDDQAGHDFWLSRNGHGAGFWDRGLGESGELLHNAAKAFGECWIEVGDDGQLHGF